MFVISVLVLFACCTLFICLSSILFHVRRKVPDNSVPPNGPQGKEFSSEEPGQWKTTGITFYGNTSLDDNGQGYSGVDLFKYGKSKATFNDKPLFPCAVFQEDAASYLYKVLELKCDSFKKNKTVYLHVVDVCNSGETVCITNTKKHGFLVDVHATAHDFIGADDGVLKGSFRVVGEVRPKDIQAHSWHGDYIICSCSGSCKGKDVVWKKRSQC